MTTPSTREIRTVFGELARDTAEQLAAGVGTVTVTPFDTRAQAVTTVAAYRDLAHSLARAGSQLLGPAERIAGLRHATRPDLTDIAMLHLVDDLHRLGHPRPFTPRPPAHGAGAAWAEASRTAAARTPPPPASDEPPIPATPGPTVTTGPRLVITEPPEPAGPTGLLPEPAGEPATEDPPPADELDAAVAAFLDPTDTTVPKVAVMGPVQVHAPGEIDPERVAVVTELIVYLATRPGRTVSAAALDDVVWPNKAVRLSTRNEAISRARNWLGADAEGDPHLRRGSDGTVSLGSRVLVDWDLFTDLTARGLAANGEGHRDLATALSLVRGQPFAHVPPRRYGWLPETYLEQDIAAAVVDTAHRLATQRLAAGDPKGARHAARQAQLIDRYDERPWRDLLLAEQHLGNRGAIRTLVEDLTTTLEVDVDDDLTEETQQLIQQLTAEGALPSRSRSAP